MPDDINGWLENFKHNWKQKNVDKVLELFSPEVKYHETPTGNLKPEKKSGRNGKASVNRKILKLRQKSFPAQRRNILSSGVYGIGKAAKEDR